MGEAEVAQDDLGQNYIVTFTIWGAKMTPKNSLPRILVRVPLIISPVGVRATASINTRPAKEGGVHIKIMRYPFTLTISRILCHDGSLDMIVLQDQGILTTFIYTSNLYMLYKKYIT